MPSQLVSSSGCCQPCDTDPVVVNIPGPQGPAGANGTNGTDGIDSFTYTTASFFVPALGSSVVVPVADTSFLPQSVSGQFFVSVQGCGYLQVTAISGLNITLKNPASGILGVPNAIPTTLISNGSLVTLAGGVGPQGAPGIAGGAPVGASYICRTSDATLTNETALDSLTAGYVKTQGSGGAGAVSTVATVPVGDISGVLPIAKGGTNLSATPTNGQLLIGNGSGFTLANLIAGSNVTITPGAGTITIASTASGSSFSYVTFTRRLTGDNLIISGTTKNPFSLGDFPVGSWSNLDPSSGFVAATGRFVVPSTGYYKIEGLFNLLGDGGVAQVIVFLRKLGSNIFQTLQFNVATTPTQALPSVSFSYIDQATSVGDYYDILIQTTSHDVNVQAGSSFSVQRIQA